MAQWEKLSYTQKQCVTSAGKLMQQLAMVGPGARIGVAASGGVDSFVLLKVLTLRQRILPFPIELMVLHINPGFDPANHQPLVDWVREQGLAAHIEAADHGPRAHSEENLKNSPCFFCCRLRRNRLFQLVRQYRLTHLALGHNADDLVSTFFLNLFQNGRVDGLAMSDEYFGGEFQLIRPLMWLEKKSIARAARQWGLPVWENPCPTAKTTRRADVMAWLENIWKNDRRLEKNTFSGLRRWALDLARKKG